MDKMLMKNRTCPLCGKTYTEYPALSRRDNETEICPACGMREALEDYYGASLDEVEEDYETMEPEDFVKKYV